jgi:hypothetical protein
MVMDGSEFGMVEDADAAMVDLQRLHPPLDPPHLDTDLTSTLPALGAPSPLLS